MNPLSVAQCYFDAWNRRDGAAIVDLFMPDATYTDPTTGGPLAGDAIAGYATGLWSSFPDLTFELSSAGVVDDHLVAAQWVMRGTQLGPWQRLPATGKRIRLPGADFLAISDGAIRSVQGHFDTRSFAEQLGLAAIVQPRAIGPYTFGTMVAVRTGRSTRPGAFSLTSLHPRSAAEAEHVIDSSRRIAADMPGIPGFISWTGLNLGSMLMTVTAWERPEDIRHFMRNEQHRTAMSSVWDPGVAAGLMTSMWVPERISVLVRCPACDRMQYGGGVDGRCACDARLPEPLAYW